MASNGLTREAILDAALALIDAHGPQNLTMRRLADRLGVTATAIYYHLNGREAILDAVADRLSGAAASDLPTAGTWDARLNAMLLRWYDHVAAHPVAMGWAMTTYANRAPVLRLHEAMLEVLLDAGFTDDAALHAKGALMRFCVGHLFISEVRAGVDSTARKARTAYPKYQSLAAASRRFDPDEHFRIGLAALLDGLTRSDLAPPRPRSARRR